MEKKQTTTDKEQTAITFLIQYIKTMDEDNLSKEYLINLLNDYFIDIETYKMQQAFMEGQKEKSTIFDFFDFYKDKYGIKII